MDKFFVVDEGKGRREHLEEIFDVEWKVGVEVDHEGAELCEVKNWPDL
jgi:hypothetical protein